MPDVVGSYDSWIRIELSFRHIDYDMYMKLLDIGGDTSVKKVNLDKAV